MNAGDDQIGFLIIPYSAATNSEIVIGVTVEAG
jgi:hypothetical protein